MAAGGVWGRRVGVDSKPPVRCGAARRRFALGTWLQLTKEAIQVIVLFQAPGRCRGSKSVVLKTAHFIGEQRGVLLKAVCKPTFAVRSRDKEFEA